MLYHRHDNLLVGAILISEHQKDAGHTIQRVSLGVVHAHFFDSLVFLFLLSDEHLCVGNELLTITAGYAVGIIMSIDKGITLAFNQITIILLSSLSGYVGRTRF